VLLVGCDDTTLTKLQAAFDPIFEEESQSLVALDARCVAPQQFTASTTSPDHDFIIINQAILRLAFADLKKLFNHALNMLHAEEGSSVMVTGMLPVFNNTRIDADWASRDAYQLLIHMRTLVHFDAALGNFEGGLLVVHPRTNPYRFTQLELDAMDVSYDSFRKNADKFIPVLSFAEMHDWLTNPSYTKRFVRNLNEKY
jgi:hypothetical protein